jgi:hypothetical protein
MNAMVTTKVGDCDGRKLFLKPSVGERLCEESD